MADSQGLGRFASSSFHDDQIFDIDLLLGELAAGGSRVMRPDLESMTSEQLNEQFDLTAALYAEHVRRLRGRVDVGRWERDQMPARNALDASLRSPFSGQDIAERSG